VGSDPTCDDLLQSNGRLHKITVYAMGDVKACLPAGKKPYFQFTFVALYNGPTDVALPALTLTAFQKELAVNNANTTPATLFTFAAKFRLEIMLGNKHRLPQPAEQRGGALARSQLEARFTFEGELVATKDWWTPSPRRRRRAHVTQGTVAATR
jgi:hypothetical protein